MRERLLISVGTSCVVFLTLLVGYGLWQVLGSLLFYITAAAVLIGVLVFTADALLEEKPK